MLRLRPEQGTVLLGASYVPPLMMDVMGSIWLLEYAEQAHPSTQLEGFDISLAQTPHRDWVPSNVKFRQYDVLTAPPNDLLEKYDIVHVRHLSYIIRNNDPAPVLRTLLKMLSTFIRTNRW